MASKPRSKMPIAERAKQFMPFAAVSGLAAALAQKEKEVLRMTNGENAEQTAPEQTELEQMELEQTELEQAELEQMELEQAPPLEKNLLDSNFEDEAEFEL